uniref:Fizzy-related protein homolog n=1 Tax=Plectus sambesii TaxID=2011161 RepID=A0A914X5V5_9BILA
MIPHDYERRFLMQHNPGTSPNKATTPTRSPQTTPTKSSRSNGGGGDRFIPIRLPNEDWTLRFAALSNSALSVEGASGGAFKRPQMGAPRAPAGANGNQQTPASAEDTRQEAVAHRALLRNELLKAKIDDIRIDFNCKSRGTPPKEANTLGALASPGLFQYQTMRTPTKYGDASTSASGGSPIVNLNSLTPLSENSQRLLKSPRKPQRKVPKNPYKVLDAPELQDDFYLNLVDWSSQNMLSVGLGSCVYLWSACNSQVVKLCDLSSESDTVTSVQWTEKGDALAVGTSKGLTQVWDVHAQKRTLNLPGHSSRIGCLAWNGDLVCSGSRDRLIIQRDIRSPPVVVERKLNAHRQEVCGLKWSPDHQYLASGGNDNQLLVWSLRKNEPVQTYTDHNAAVKALAWSPHHHGLLVSGGGTADRCMRFWNTLTGQAMQCIDTGSQVCNVAWSKHSNELVSTHGYSQNQINIWKYPSLQQITKLTGHTYRVLYLAMSPDGESIVTGAGDETLRFWHVFSKAGQCKAVRSKLNLFTSIR